VNTARTTDGACYNCRMSDGQERGSITVRTFRNGIEEARDTEWRDSSAEERIEAVWMLTQLCLAWNNRTFNEPRLQRTITNVQRARR
jgi:hypothetical protein